MLLITSLSTEENPFGGDEAAVLDYDSPLHQNDGFGCRHYDYYFDDCCCFAVQGFIQANVECHQEQFADS